VVHVRWFDPCVDMLAYGYDLENRPQYVSHCKKKEDVGFDYGTVEYHV